MTDEGGITRIVTRHEPITVVLDRTKEKFVAVPLFWRDRDKLGALIATEYTKATNGREAVSLLRDEESGVDVLQWNFRDYDYPKVCTGAYPEVDPEKFQEMHVEEMMGLLMASLEVNGLQRFDWMIDPSKKDVLSEVMDLAAEQGIGPKMPSTTDASSSESTPTPSSTETEA